MQTKKKKKGRRKKKLFLSITTGDHWKFNSRGDGELMGIGKQHQRHFSMVTNGKRKGEWNNPKSSFENKTKFGMIS